MFTNVQTYGSIFKRLKALSLLGIPFGDMLPDVPDPDGNLEPGCLFYLTTTSKLYAFDGNAWIIAGGGDPTWGAIVGNISDQTDLITKFANYQLLSQKDFANGYAGLDGSGKINPSQLPAIAITDTFVVASQAAMLALSAQTGDIAVRTDLNDTFILRGSNPATLSDWQELLTPTSPVTSVFGRVGVVTAQANDYTFAQIGSKPTTLAGYGIIDAYPLSSNPAGYLTSAPVTSVFGRTGAITAQSNDYTWAQINKSSSSLADLTTRSASDLSTGTLAQTRGGTGFGTYTTGDILYSSATNTLSKLGIGSSSQVLTVVGGVPMWQTPAPSPWLLSGNDIYFPTYKVGVGNRVGSYNGNLDVNNDNDGTNITSTKGLWLSNNQGAASSSSLQYPPAIYFSGYGYATTGGSTNAIMRINYQPVSSSIVAGVQGSSGLSFSSYNGSGWNAPIIIGGNGQMSGVNVLAGSTYQIGINSSSFAGPFDIASASGIVGATIQGLTLNSLTATTTGSRFNMYSPAFRLRGSALNASSAAQDLIFQQEVRTTQGSTPITGSWALSSSLAGGAYVDRFTINDAGNGAFNGSISIGGTSLAASSALLDVVSTTKGVLIPRMTSTQKFAIGTPATALQVYDNVLNRVSIYTSAWQNLAYYGESNPVPYSTKTSAYTTTLNDEVILADASGGAFSVTILTAVGNGGKIYVVKKIDSTANAVTIAFTGGQSADGSSTKILNTQYSGFRLMSNGTNYSIIGIF